MGGFLGDPPLDSGFSPSQSEFNAFSVFPALKLYGLWLVGGIKVPFAES